MASAYNLVGRSAVAVVRDGRIRLLIRRETVEDFRPAKSDGESPGARALWPCGRRGA